MVNTQLVAPCPGTLAGVLSRQYLLNCCQHSESCLSAESEIYGKKSNLRVCKWIPAADDFLEALKTLGYRVPHSASSKRKRGARGDSTALTHQASYSGPLPQLAHLTLLLRLLCPLCEAQVCH